VFNHEENFAAACESERASEREPFPKHQKWTGKLFRKLLKIHFSSLMFFFHIATDVDVLALRCVPFTKIDINYFIFI
jgi:hypothetical protein